MVGKEFTSVDPIETDEDRAKVGMHMCVCVYVDGPVCVGRGEEGVVS